MFNHSGRICKSEYPDRIYFDRRILMMLFQLMDRSCWFHLTDSFLTKSVTRQFILPFPLAYSLLVNWFLISSIIFRAFDSLRGEFHKISFPFDETGRRLRFGYNDTPPYYQPCHEPPTTSPCFACNACASPLTSFSEYNIARHKYLALAVPFASGSNSAKMSLLYPLPIFSLRPAIERQGIYDISRARVHTTFIQYSPVR